MSQTGQGDASPNSMGERVFVPPPVKSRWTGWVVFAALMMIVLGIFQAIEGLTALFRHTYYAVGSNGLLVGVSYTTWGWAHLLLGVLALAAGFALMAGYLWGRIVGVLIAVVSATTQLAFVAAAPVWAVTVIVLDVVIIYAISVHGGELKT
jgi:hypothetical protein